MRRRIRLPALAAAALVAGIGALALLLSRDDWNWARPIVEWGAGRLSGRSIEIADLRVDFGRRVDVTMRGLRVGNPDWARGREMFAADRVGFRARLLPLLLGRLDLERLDLGGTKVALERRRDGVGNWRFGGGGRATEMPAALHLENLDLTLIDPARPRGFALHVDELRSRRFGAVYAFGGHGTYQQEPFRVEAATLGLPHAGVERTPARISARVGNTAADAAGWIGDGRGETLFDLRLAARGDSLDDLWRLAGFPLPRSPHFAVAGRFDYTGGAYSLSDFRGRLGKSDLAGTLVVRLPARAGAGRTRIAADVRSHALDLDDIEGFWGRAPREEGAPHAVAAGSVDSVFPDLPFSFPKLRVADADLNFRADRVQGKSLLDHVRLAATLRSGKLDLHPLSLGMSAGQLDADATIDARGARTRLDADLRLRGVDFAELLRRVGVKESGRGELGGRASIQSVGNSLHELAENVDGEVGTVLRHGSLSDPLLELAALHLGDYILAKLDDHDDDPIRCLIGVFDGKDGVLDARTLLLDTAHVRIEGEGTIDLGRERLDLELEQHAKQFAVGALRTPLLIEGPFTGRRARLKRGPLLKRGGVAVALGAAIHPLAALLAVIDPGKNDKPDACAEALAEYRPIAANVQATKVARPRPKTPAAGPS